MDEATALKQRATSDMFMASYISDELKNLLDDLAPMATTPADKAKLAALRASFDESARKRAEMLSKARYV
jgi:hypothetical protein